MLLLNNFQLQSGKILMDGYSSVPGSNSLRTTMMKIRRSLRMRRTQPATTTKKKTKIARVITQMRWVTKKAAMSPVSQSWAKQAKAGMNLRRRPWKMTGNKEWPDNKQHRVDAVDRQMRADHNQAPNRMPDDDEKIESHRNKLITWRRTDLIWY